jgi:cell wall-associated NlpC family hydrolase
MSMINGKILKVAALVVLAAIVLSIIAFGPFRKSRQVHEKQETIIVDTVVIIPDTKLSLRDSIVNFGMGLLGTPYSDGSCSPDGFDCSGFVYYVFQHFRIKVPRSSSQFKDFGKEIPIEKVQKGDILVFLSPTRNAIGHVGIVTNPKGMQTDFIHSSSGKEMKVIISNLKSAGYTRRFVKAVDVL